MPRKVNAQPGLETCPPIPRSHRSPYVSALYERMRADQKKFGKSTWAAAVERIERLQYAVSKETLQLMRAKEICLEQKKHAVKEEVKNRQIKFDTNADMFVFVVGGYQRDSMKKGLCVREMTSCSRPQWRE